MGSTFLLFLWRAQQIGCTLGRMTDKHNLNSENNNTGSHTFPGNEHERVTPEFHTEEAPERVEKVVPAQETHVERVNEQPVVEAHRERPQRVVEDTEKKGSALPWIIGIILLLLLAGFLWWLLGGQNDEAAVEPSTTTVDVTTQVTETVSPEASPVEETPAP